VIFSKAPAPSSYPSSQEPCVLLFFRYLPLSSRTPSPLSIGSHSSAPSSLRHRYQRPGTLFSFDDTYLFSCLHMDVQCGRWLSQCPPPSLNRRPHTPFPVWEIILSFLQFAASSDCLWRSSPFFLERLSPLPLGGRLFSFICFGFPLRILPSNAVLFRSDQAFASLASLVFDRRRSLGLAPFGVTGWSSPTTSSRSPPAKVSSFCRKIPPFSRRFDLCHPYLYTLWQRLGGVPFSFFNVASSLPSA